MKQTIRNTVIVGIVFILGLAIVATYKKNLYGDKNELNKVHIVVIDTSSKLDLNADDILSGSDPILLRINPNGGDESSLMSVLSFENIAQLLNINEYNNGYIDTNNPVFSQIYVAVIDKRHSKLEKMSLKKAGFIAIALEPDFINAALSNKMEQLGNGVGNIAKDGNQRLGLKIIQFNISQLNELLHPDEILKR